MGESAWARCRAALRRARLPKPPWWAALGCAAVFALLLLTDEQTRRACDVLFEILPLRFAGYFLSELVDYPLLVAAVVLLAAFGGRDGRRAAAALVVALVAQAICVEVLRDIAGRARPMVSGGATEFLGPALGVPGHDSLPSGHAATAFALAVVVGAYWPRGRGAVFCFAVAVALARIVVRAHFWADVFLGSAIGLYCGWLAVVNVAPLRGGELAALSRPRQGPEKGKRDEADIAQRKEHGQN